MLFRCALVFTCAALVLSNDITVGNEGGNIIFDENRQASPAVWRQVSNVTVNATDSEVISRVVINDLRPEKDGDAKIVEGGEGQKNVVIELKSPTVLRGYDFHIQVFAKPEGEVQNPVVTGVDSSTQSSSSEHPISIAKDASDSTRQARDVSTTEINPTIKSEISTPELKINGEVSSTQQPTSTQVPLSSTTLNFGDRASTPVPVVPAVFGSNEGTSSTEKTRLVRATDSTTEVIKDATVDDAITTESGKNAHEADQTTLRNAFYTGKPFTLPIDFGKTETSTTEHAREARDVITSSSKPNTLAPIPPSNLGEDTIGSSTSLPDPVPKSSSSYSRQNPKEVSSTPFTLSQTDSIDENQRFNPTGNAGRIDLNNQKPLSIVPISTTFQPGYMSRTA